MDPTLATISKDAAPLWKTGGELLKLLFSGPAESAGAVIKDQIEYYRANRLMILAEKLKTRMDALGITAKALPPSAVIPILEAASLAESEETTDLYAELLAAATTKDIYQHPMLRNAVGELDANEVKILSHLGKGRSVTLYLMNSQDVAPPMNLRGRALHIEFGADGPGHFEWPELHLDNLERIGLIWPGPSAPLNRLPDHVEVLPAFASVAKVVDGQWISRAHAVMNLTEAGKLLGDLAARIPSCADARSPGS